MNKEDYYGIINFYNKNGNTMCPDTKIFIKKIDIITITYYLHDSVYLKIYKIINKIGSGGSGVVFKILDITTKKNIDIFNKYSNFIVTNNEYLALKLNTSHNESHVSSEALLLIEIFNDITIPEKYKYFPKFLGIDRLDFMVTPYFGNMNLADLVYNLDQKNVLKIPHILNIVLQQLSYYNNKFKHNDIKVTNIVLDENYQPKIIDFGLSTADLTDLQDSSLVSFAPEGLLPFIIYKKMNINIKKFKLKYKFLFDVKLYASYDMIGFFWTMIDCFTNNKSHEILKIILQNENIHYERLYCFYLRNVDIKKYLTDTYGINNVELITSFIDVSFVNKVSFNKLIIDRTNPIIIQYLFFNHLDGYNKFLDNMIHLILTPDSEMRISYKALLINPFFYSV